MTTKNQTSWGGFRKQARARAARLEKEATATRLVAMAEDPLDALATLWDLAAFAQHAARARTARLHGRNTPQPPVAISRLLSGFSEQLRDKCTAIVGLLHEDEIERLGQLTSGFVSALEGNDADVMLLVRDLLPRAPDEVASWLRAHLGALETRFAS